MYLDFEGDNPLVDKSSYGVAEIEFSSIQVTSNAMKFDGLTDKIFVPYKFPDFYFGNDLNDLHVGFSITMWIYVQEGFNSKKKIILFKG